MRAMLVVRWAGTLTCLVLGLSALVPATAGAATAAQTVTVSSRSGWVPVQVQSGQRYVLKATGTWTVDRRSVPHTRAAGYGLEADRAIWVGCKLTNARYGTLLGKVGPHGRPFAVGNAHGVTGDGTGVLYLRINDKDECLGDNEGSVVVTIR